MNMIKRILRKVGICKKPSSVDTFAKYVPYQICPKCQGDGTVFIHACHGSETSFSSGPHTCDLCKGEKVIPMHKNL